MTGSVTRGLALSQRPAAAQLHQRAVAAWLLTVVGLPLMTVVLTATRDALSLESILLLYLLVVVVIAVVGGAVPGLVAAVTADLLANYFLVPPYGTLHIESRDHVVAILVFMVVAGIVSVLVEVSARRREEIGRSRAEAELLARLAEAPVGEVAAGAVLDEMRRTFELSVSRLVDERGLGGRRVVEVVGSDRAGDVTSVLNVGEGLTVVVGAPPRMALDMQAMRALALSAARAYEGRKLAEEAEQAHELAELDRVRSALLAAVGHDLRTPLAGIKAAVSSLRQTDVRWTPAEQAELLATIEESADRLDGLVANLLDMTRIQAGSVVVDVIEVSVDEVVARALSHLPAAEMHLDIPESLPLIRTDPGLLERALANVVENAVRYRPTDTLVEVFARQSGEKVTISVADRGPGIPVDSRAEVFEPFQRLDDRSQGGTGLGLAIARGFVQAVGGSIDPVETPGGGLTMTLTVPVAT